MKFFAEVQDSPDRAGYNPTIRKKLEGWGTRPFVLVENGRWVQRNGAAIGVLPTEVPGRVLRSRQGRGWCGRLSW
jgi:hypothetical protein